MRNKLRISIALLLLVFISYGAKAFTAPDHYLVSYEFKYTYTKDSLDRFWKKSHIPQVIVPVRNGVDMYEVTYKGMWLDSTFIIAKGVLFIPKTDKPSAEVVFDSHGTRISPLQQSCGLQDLEQVATMMYAVDNYIAMFPYYYGLGGGEKEHVYQDAFTESMASIYMIKACREIYPQIKKESSGQLFLTGYTRRE